MPIPSLSVHEKSIGTASLYATTFPDRALIPIAVAKDGTITRLRCDLSSDTVSGRFGNDRASIGLDVALCKDFSFFRGVAGSDPFPKSRQDRFAPVYRPTEQQIPQFREGGSAGTTIYVLRARPRDVVVMHDAPVLPPTLRRITDEVLWLPTPSDPQFGPFWLSDVSIHADRDPYRNEVTP